MWCRCVQYMRVLVMKDVGAWKIIVQGMDQGVVLGHEAYPDDSMKYLWEEVSNGRKGMLLTLIYDDVDKE